MTEKRTADSDLRDEFKKLGENMHIALKEAWESEERRRVSDEIQKAFQEIGEALSEGVERLAARPEAQKLREEVDELAERVRSGEVADRMRSDLIGVLKRLNAQIETLAQKLEQDDEGDDERPTLG